MPTEVPDYFSPSFLSHQEVGQWSGNNVFVGYRGLTGTRRRSWGVWSSRGSWWRGRWWRRAAAAAGAPGLRPRPACPRPRLRASLRTRHVSFIDKLCLARVQAFRLAQNNNFVIIKWCCRVFLWVYHNHRIKSPYYPKPELKKKTY